MAQVAARFGVGVARVTRWIKTPVPQTKRRKPATKINMEALAQDVRDHPDAYQSERARRLGVSQQGIEHALWRLGVTYKKTLRHPTADADARRSFQGTLSALEATGRLIVYSDASGFAHDRPRPHGCAPLGERCDGVKDGHARGRTHVIGALLGQRLCTVGLFNTTINADMFGAGVTHDLLPTLPPHCVLVMDNATCHKRQDRQHAIAIANHLLLFLPPYSPDLNPIEAQNSAP